MSGRMISGRAVVTTDSPSQTAPYRFLSSFLSVIPCASHGPFPNPSDMGRDKSAQGHNRAGTSN